MTQRRKHLQTIILAFNFDASESVKYRNINPMFIIHNIFTKHILFHIFTLFRDCSILHSLPISQPNCSQAEAMNMKINQTEWEELFFSFRRHQCCVAYSCVSERDQNSPHCCFIYDVVNNSWARPSINMCQRRLFCCTLQTKMENTVVTMTNVFPHYPPGWYSTIKPISVRVLQEEWLSHALHWKPLNQYSNLRVARALWRSRGNSHTKLQTEVQWAKGAKQN